MDSYKEVLPKVGGSNTSSSAVSGPQGKGLDNTNSPESFHKFLKSKELVQSSFDKVRKGSALSKCKTSEHRRMLSKGGKNLDLKRTMTNVSASAGNHASRKQSRKVEHPARLPSSNEGSVDYLSSKPLICKNSACRAVLGKLDTFCKRCSCCICHMFDDNKDPSLWLVCASESRSSDSCGFSCHLECALQHHKAGVVNVGHGMQLDGSYCCASCGQISSIIECWKKQLAVAKEARRVDVLCYRISLSFRLLDGTSHFKELHEIVEDAKIKLETEVGAINGVSAKMARGIVSRLCVANDVQRICDLAVQKADEWLKSVANSSTIQRENSFPAACKFQFEDVASSSLVVVLKDTSSSNTSAIIGYKLWYFLSREHSQEKDPVVFPKSQRRILISNLRPCTEYTFQIISFTETGDFGHSESKCFTKSVELIHKSSEKCKNEGGSSGCKRKAKFQPSCSTGFRVRDLGKVLRRAWAEEHSELDGFCSGLEEESCGGTDAVELNIAEERKLHNFDSRELDLNVASVPDLNVDAVPSTDCSDDEGNGYTTDKNMRSGHGDKNDCDVRPKKAAGEVHAVESRTELCRKLPMDANGDGDSNLLTNSPLRFSDRSLTGRLDEDYEFCVKVIRWLECREHIEKDFRMKFLTWFSLKSNEQERRVVHTFIDTLIDDPGCLADQLLDSFLEIVTCKKPRSGFCSKLWH